MFVFTDESDVFWSHSPDSGTPCSVTKKTQQNQNTLIWLWKLLKRSMGEGKALLKASARGGTIACPGHPCIQFEKWFFPPLICPLGGAQATLAFFSLFFGIFSPLCVRQSLSALSEDVHVTDKKNQNNQTKQKPNKKNNLRLQIK